MRHQRLACAAGRSKDACFNDTSAHHQLAPQMTLADYLTKVAGQLGAYRITCSHQVVATLLGHLWHICPYRYGQKSGHVHLYCYSVKWHVLVFCIWMQGFTDSLVMPYSAYRYRYNVGMHRPSRHHRISRVWTADSHYPTSDMNSFAINKICSPAVAYSYCKPHFCRCLPLICKPSAIRRTDGSRVWSLPLGGADADAGREDATKHVG